MGNRITIDCATLMNKGFEVIEACWLFDFTPSQVDVVIHPQSTVHAMIEYTRWQRACADFSDGYAHAHPIRAHLSRTAAKRRCRRSIGRQARQWEFLPPDFEKFPLLKLAYRCQEAGGSATCTLNAADEIAVEAFLEERIGYPAIYEIVSETLSNMPERRPPDRRRDSGDRPRSREPLARRSGARRAARAPVTV